MNQERGLLCKICKVAKSVRSDLSMMRRGGTPLPAIFDYLLTRFVLKPGMKRKYRQEQEKFLASAGKLDFTTGWFDPNIPYWLHTFERHHLDKKPALNALEIGSWEGRSSLFLLSTLPNMKLTCVDTWAGADEHQGLEILNTLEKRFDSNMASVRDRLTKYKGTSYSYFADDASAQQFDLVYIDGSHYSDDVLIDALKGFEKLKVGGLMIMDDYLWEEYRRINDNPIGAINAFLKMKKGYYRLVRVYHQLIVQKTMDRQTAAETMTMYKPAE